MTTHGQSRTPEYKTWVRIITRCYNKHNPDYINYGGRGIRMSAIWRNDYLRFRQGVEKRPDGMTLDRIDNDGHYEPGNVRWADRDTQSKNRRCVKTYNYDNKDLNITELSKKLSLPKSSLHRWLVYDKLSLQEVIQRKIP